MDVVKTEIDEVLDYKGMKDTGKHPIDKTGKSKFTRIYYKLSNGSAEIVCYDMSKKLEKGKSYGGWMEHGFSIDNSVFEKLLKD